ncbi:MAG: hypothetical protein WD009_07530 [Phycisphaeraceae bacterium]
MNGTTISRLLAASVIGLAAGAATAQDTEEDQWGIERETQEEQQMQTDTEAEPGADVEPFAAPGEDELAAEQPFREAYDQATETISGTLVDAEAYLLFGHEVATDAQDERSKLSADRPLALVTSDDEAYLILDQRGQDQPLPFVAPEGEPQQPDAQPADSSQSDTGQASPEPAEAQPSDDGMRSPIRERNFPRSGRTPILQARDWDRHPGELRRAPTSEPQEPSDAEQQPEAEQAQEQQSEAPSDAEIAPFAEPGARAEQIHAQPGQQLEVTGAVFERGGIRAIVVTDAQVAEPGQESEPDEDPWL